MSGFQKQLMKSAPINMQSVSEWVLKHRGWYRASSGDGTSQALFRVG
jgi:hypothetical protein